MRTTRTLLFAAAGLLAFMTATSTFAQSATDTDIRPKQKSDDDAKKTEATPKKAKVGEAAPNFELKDTTGKTHKLSDYKGKTIILQWVNPTCPVCKGVMKKGLVAKMVKDAKAIDPTVVHLMINSTHFQTAEDTAKYLKEHKMKSPGLIDSDGTVGRLYSAKTTPHMFVIDKKGVLQYSGAFDNDRRGQKGSDAVNYAVSTIRQLAAKEKVSPNTTQPYGCSVKYKKAEGDNAGKRGKGRGTRGEGRGARGTGRGAGDGS